MLTAGGIAKSYDDVVALRSVDLEVAAGQIVALLGRNGAGKSTLLSIVAGLTRPDAGSVTIGGVDALRQPRQAARQLGIAPQETGIYPVLTVRENLEFFCDLAGVDRGARRNTVDNVIERLGLVDLRDRRAGNLSGGETRRLHTGCALVKQPRLLMLDEPTVGADVATRAQLIEAVNELSDEGAAIVYTTHYLHEVEMLDADIVIIDDGLVLARGSRGDLMNRYRVDGIEFKVDGPLSAEGSANLAGLDVSELGPGHHRVSSDMPLEDFVARLQGSDRLVSISEVQPDLEAVFLAVTGEELSGDAPTGRAT